MATMVKEFNTPTCDVGMRRCKSDWSPFDYADVAELADALGLGPSVLKDVRVRLSPSAFAHRRSKTQRGHFRGLDPRT